jgi:hypothetical protein
MSSKKVKPKGSKTTKKAAKPVIKADAKPATKAVRTKGRGVRYDEAKKQEVVDFVISYNDKKGRGGQSAAARKFGVTILTVSSWLKGSGNVAAKGGKALKADKLSGSVAGKVKALLDLGDRIRKADAELQKLQGQYSSLSASIRAVI